MDVEPITQTSTMSFTVRAVVLLVLLAGSVGLASMPLTAQSLGDLAKKEEERRKTIKQPAKVLTNKDLVAVPPPATPPDAGMSSADTDQNKQQKGADATPAAGGGKEGAPEAGKD